MYRLGANNWISLSRKKPSRFPVSMRHPAVLEEQEDRPEICSYSWRADITKHRSQTRGGRGLNPSWTSFTKRGRLSLPQYARNDDRIEALQREYQLAARPPRRDPESRIRRLTGEYGSMGAGRAHQALYKTHSSKKPPVRDQVPFLRVTWPSGSHGQAGTQTALTH